MAATGPRARLRAEERRATVIPLVLAGAGYRDVARELNVSHTTIVRDVQAALEEWKARHLDQIDHQRLVDLARLERMLQAIWADVIKAQDDRKIELALAILREKRQILGYGKTPRLEVTGANGGPVQMEMEARIEDRRELDLRNLSNEDLDFLEKLADKLPE